MFLALFMGHLHAEPLHCFLPAVYFSIYSSNVLLRQCPTLSGRFFSTLRLSVSIIRQILGAYLKHFGAQLPFMCRALMLCLD